MHPVVERLRIALVFTMVLFAGSSVLVGRALAEPAPSAKCVAAAYRQFDFWVGDWDVFDVGSSIPVAHARIDPILDGCVLREDYQGTDGHNGQRRVLSTLSPNAPARNFCVELSVARRAFAIRGFVRSRRRGGRGGAMGFACAIRDLFVAGLGWADW
jgi:hypothetical protein